MEILSSLFFPLIELWQLRNYEGRSRLHNTPDPKRNVAFYQKLEEALFPFFEDKSFRKIAKRKFIKEINDKIQFYELGLNKDRNGLAIDFGIIDSAKHTVDKLKGRNSLTSFARKQKRLTPTFWKYDYQYPVRSSDSRDKHIIEEIQLLLKSDFHQQSWEEMLEVV